MRQFDGSKLRFFWNGEERNQVARDGLFVTVSPGEIHITGLKEIPPDAKYFLVLDSTPSLQPPDKK